jgi:hypothetical protein
MDAFGGTIVTPEYTVYSTPLAFRFRVRPPESAMGMVNRHSLQSTSISAPTTNFASPDGLSAASLAASQDMSVRGSLASNITFKSKSRPGTPVLIVWTKVSFAFCLDLLHNDCSSQVSGGATNAAALYSVIRGLGPVSFVF